MAMIELPIWRVERALLGALILDAELVGEVASVVTAADFHRRPHGELFALIQRLAEAGPADLEIVMAAIGDDFDRYGGAAYVAALPSTTSLESAPVYARRVRAASRARALDLALVAARAKLESGVSADEVSTWLEGLARPGASTDEDRGFVHYGELAAAVYDEMCNPAQTVIVPTGFVDLDRLLNGGMRPGQLVILAGRPAMGKSQFACVLGLHVARGGVGVGIYSAEMARGEVARRLMAADGRIAAAELRRPDQISQRTWDGVVPVVETAQRLPIWVDDKEGRPLKDLRRHIKRLMAKAAQNGTPLGVVVVDYLQLMEAQGDSRQDAVAALVRGLKNLAKELTITIVALSQLNRKCEERTDKRPMIADLRETGEIENAANVILTVYRDEYYNPETSTDRGIAEVNVQKNRDGKTGVVRLTWSAEFQLFESIESRY